MFECTNSIGSTKREHSILGVKHARIGRRESRRGKGRGGRVGKDERKGGGRKEERKFIEPILILAQTINNLTPLD